MIKTLEGKIALKEVGLTFFIMKIMLEHKRSFIGLIDQP